jgi:hypothetical protein
MDERYFKMFLQKYKEKEEEINLLDAELEKSTITKEIERIKKEKKEGEEEINLINKEKEKVKKRLGEININELKKVLEEKIVETIDKKIIIS